MSRLFLRVAAVLAGVAAPVIARAAMPSEVWIYCGNLPGCPSGFVEHITGALTLLLLRLPQYVYMLAVLFIVIGGAMILLSAGEQDKVNKGKSTITWAIIGIFAMNFATTLIGFVVLEVQTRSAGTDLVESVTNTLIGAVFDLLYIAIVGVALFCGMRMVVSFGKDDEYTKARDGLFWCAVGAIIINMADSIVRAFLTF